VEYSPCLHTMVRTTSRNNSMLSIGTTNALSKIDSSHT
jgi:hypothetical protein